MSNRIQSNQTNRFPCAGRERIHSRHSSTPENKSSGKFVGSKPATDCEI